MSKTRLGTVPPVISVRLRACRSRIQQERLDGYLVTDRTEQLYLTGFDGEDGAALILRGRVYLLTDGRFTEEAGRSAGWAKAVVRIGPITEVLAPLVDRHRLKRIGFNPAHLSVSAHKSYAKAVRPGRLVALAEMAKQMRLIKDPTELDALREAIRIAEAAFLSVVGRIRIGMTERELAADLQHEMLRCGADVAAFPIIVAEGPNSSRPHAMPGNRRIRKGSAILIDWGAVCRHYRSDLTRVVFVHKIPPRFRRMYEAVLAAQAEGIRAVRPGARMCDVYERARASLEAAGMARQFTHGLGHGIGLEVHEPPSLSKPMTDPLMAGMVVTVEPGVYFPGIGGVRIEDDVLVTETGARVMSRLPKDLDSMVV